MAIATGILAVNAAFLRDIKDDNRRLHDLLDETSRLFASTNSVEVKARRVVNALVELRDQLALHFALEEAYGYFEDALESTPNLTERAEKLRSQHRELFVELCGIVDQAEQGLYHENPKANCVPLEERFQRFLDDLRQHEAREVDMIMEALSNDVGVGD